VGWVCSHTSREPAELAAIAGMAVTCAAGASVNPSVQAAPAVPADGTCADVVAVDDR
jgi:hypothetical protein